MSTPLLASANSTFVAHRSACAAPASRRMKILPLSRPSSAIVTMAVLRGMAFFQMRDEPDNVRADFRGNRMRKIDEAVIALFDRATTVLQRRAWLPLNTLI